MRFFYRFLFLTIVIIGFSCGSLFSQQVTYDWQHIIPGGHYTSLWCMDTDSSGNMYVGGRIDSTVTFVDTTVANADVTGFLAKFTPDGDMVWFKQFEYSRCVYSMCFDSENNLYISGSYDGKVRIDDTLLYTHDIDTTFFGMFLAKFDTDGNRIWAKTTGGTYYYESGYGKLKQMTIDKDDNLVIVGFGIDDLEYFDTTGTYDPTDSIWVTSPWPPHWEYPSYYSNYMVKYNKEGQKIWIRDLGACNQHYLAIATDYSNNILLTGYFWRDYPFIVDSVTLSTTSLESIFIIKYNPNGHLIWAQKAGGSSNGNQAYDIVSDENNNVYVTGVVTGNNITFGGNIFLTFGTDHIFLTNFSPSGNVNWFKHYGTEISASNFDYGLGLSYKNNEIFLCGFFYDSLKLGYEILNSFIPSSSASGIFIRFNTNGDLIDAAMDQVIQQCTPSFFYYGLDNNYYVAGNLIDLEGSLIMFSRFSGAYLLNNPELSAKSGNIVFFPNPCSEYLTILSDLDHPFLLEIINISGKPVLCRTINEPLSQISISSLPNGIYFIKVENQVSKLIVN